MNGKTPAIEVKRLFYAVDGRVILSGIDLTVWEREILGIIGASGSGKSTLIKCMAGLLFPSAGSIKIAGSEIVGVSDKELAKARRNLGFVFQYSALFDSLTVFENIALAPCRRLRLPRRKLKELAREKLNQVQLGDIMDYYPSQLSGGMAKRVGLARALSMNPRILFYDEPTSGLDPPTARSIDRLIQRMRDELGVTSVVISHDLHALCRYADRIALLENGKIALIASPREILQSRHPSVANFLRADDIGNDGEEGSE